MRTPKPWFRNDRKSYFLEVGKKQIDLETTDEEIAQRKADGILGRVGRCEPGVYLVRHIVAEYETWLKKNRAPSTYDSRKYLLRDLKNHLLSGAVANEVKPFMVEAFLDTLNLKSPSTKRDRITFLQGMFTWAVDYGMLAHNPIARMPKPEARIRQEFVPSSRFQELLDVIVASELKDFVLVMLDSGARAQDMFKFESKHLHEDRLTLEIKDSKGRKRSHVIYLPELSQEIVHRLARQYPTGKLFRNTRGRPWTKNSINCQFRRLKEKMGMQSLCATTLRHSFAHHRLTSKQDSLVVSKLLNHVDGRMLARRYGHLEGSAFLAKEAARVPTFKGKDAITVRPGAILKAKT